MAIRQNFILVVLLMSSMLAARAGDAQTADDNHRNLTVGLIQDDATVYGGVIFSEVVQSRGILMVEREEIDQIMREAGLLLQSDADAIRLGAMSKSALLVFVKTVEDRLFARIVETRNGVRLFEAMEPASVAGAECLGNTVRRQIEKFRSQFPDSSQPRQYVAVEPFAFKKNVGVVSPDAAEFRLLDALLGLYIARQPGMVCVERESLDRVAFEEGLDAGGESVAHIQADWLLRGECELKTPQVARVTMKLRSLRGENGDVLIGVFDVSVTNIGEGVATMLAWVLDAIERDRGSSLPLDRSFEAEAQYQLGRAYLARGLKHHAIRCFRVAHWLCPDENRFVEELVSALLRFRGTPERIKKTGEGIHLVARQILTEEEMLDMIEAMDLCQYTLKKKTMGLPFSQSRWPWIEGGDSGNSLYDVPVELKGPEGRGFVSHFRSRLRAYMEWLQAFEPEGRAFRWRHLLSPFFFDNPEDAIAYMREVVAEDNCHGHCMALSKIPYIRYWDGDRASMLWKKFLLDVSESSRGPIKYAALQSLAVFLHGYNAPAGTLRKDGTPAPCAPDEGVAAVQNLFRWLAENESEYPVIRNNYRVPGPVNVEVDWRGFRHMDMEFQRRHLSSLMMADEISSNTEDWPHYFVFEAMHRVLAAYPDDQTLHAQVKKDLNAYLAKFTNSPCSGGHNNAVFRLRKRPDLFDMADPALTASLDGVKSLDAGLELIFDSRRDLPGWMGVDYALRNFKYSPFSAYMNYPYAWVAWFLYEKKADESIDWKKQKRMICLRIDVRTNALQFFEIPVSDSVPHSCDVLGVVRWHNRLYIVSRIAVTVVPIDPRTDMLDVDGAHTVGKEGLPSYINPDPQGREKKMTILAAGKDLIYIYMKPGHLLQWNVAAGTVDTLVRFDQFSNGPLSDTTPFDVRFAQYNQTQDAVDFYVVPEGPTPKKGWWRYRRGDKPSWEWLTADRFRLAQRVGEGVWETYMDQNAQSLVYPRHYLKYTKGNDASITVAVATGIVLTTVAQCPEAALWLVHRREHDSWDRRRSFASLQIYLVKREHWPEASSAME